MQLTLISFGYLHLDGEGPPVAEHVLDVRDRLSDPAGYHEVLAMLEHGPVDGRDARVQEVVLRDPGAAGLLDELAAIARMPGVSTVAAGCGQGHDRSVAVVELAAERARRDGRDVVIDHRHVHLSRVR